MKKVVIGLILVAVIIVAVVALFIWPSRQFRAALDDGLAMLKANEALQIESAGYKSACYSLLGGQASVEGLAIKFKPGSSPTEYTFGRINGSGVPLKLLASLMRGDGEVFIAGFKAFDELEIKNLNYKMADEKSTMVYSQQSAKIKELAFKPSSGIPNAKQKRAEFANWLVNQMRYDSSEDRGIEVIIILKEENSKMVFKVAQGGSTGYDNLKLGKVFAKDVRLVMDLSKEEYDDDEDTHKTDSHQLEIKLGELSADNLDFSRASQLLAVAASGNDQALNQYMQKANMLLPYYGFDQVEFGPLEALWDNKSVAQMEQLLSVGPVVAGKFPPRVTYTMKGVVIDLAQLPIPEDEWKNDNFLKALNGMKYTKIKADFNAEMLYSEEAKTLEVKQYTLDVAEAFKLDQGFKLSSFDVGTADTDLMTVALGLAGLTLDNVQVTLTDQGLAPRLNSYFSQQLTGKDDQAAFTEILLQGLEQAMPMVGSLLENPVPVMTEIKAFVSEPKKITLASGNTSPLPLVAFARMDELAVIKALKLSLTVNDRAPVEISPLGGDPGMPDMEQDDDFFEQEINND